QRRRRAPGRARGLLRDLRERDVEIRRDAPVPLRRPGPGPAVRVRDTPGNGAPRRLSPMTPWTVSLSRQDWSLHRKGPMDQARHNENVKEAIKDNLPGIISEEAIITSA